MTAGAHEESDRFSRLCRQSMLFEVQDWIANGQNSGENPKCGQGLKHYFRPGREDVRKALENAMPRLLTGTPEGKTLPGKVVSEEKQTYAEGVGPGELLEQALKELEAVKSKSKRIASAVKHVKQAKEWVDSRVVRETEVARAD